MKWRKYKDEQGAVMRSDEPDGFSIWPEHEWLDRRVNVAGEAVGAMRKREFIMLQTPKGDEYECKSVLDAKRKARGML